MSPEKLFSVCNSLAPFGWLLMWFAPTWKGTQWLVRYLIIPLLFSFVYIGLIISAGSLSFSDFGTLAGIKKLFSNDYLLVAGWVHYLAFDLFVGSWILLKGQEAKIPHLYLIVCTFFTFMLGPIGLLLFHIVRYFHTKKLQHENF